MKKKTTFLKVFHMNFHQVLQQKHVKSDKKSHQVCEEGVRGVEKDTGRLMKALQSRQENTWRLLDMKSGQAAKWRARDDC